MPERLRNLSVALRNIVLVCTIVMAGVSALRFTSIERTLLFGLIPLAPMLVLAGVVIAGALSGVRLFAAGVVSAVIAFALALPGAVLPRTGCDVTEVQATESIVVMSHNLLIVNTDAAAVRAQIESIDPDVVALQEVSNEFGNTLLVELAEQYPYSIFERNQALLSRWPMSNTSVVELVSGTKPMLSATIESPIGDLRIANFHSDPPFRPELRANQKQQFERLADDFVPGDLDMLIGDFNAPSSDKRYRDLRSLGFTDGHSSVGCGRAATWSRFGPSGPAMLSLDHALVTDAFVAESFEILGYAGSDHKAIAVRVSAAS